MTVPTPLPGSPRPGVPARRAVRTLRALALTAVLALPAAACASTVEGSATAAGGAVAPTTSAASDPTTTTTEPGTTTDAPPAGGGGAGGTQAFGTPYPYDNGLEVTVGPGVPFTPSDTAAGGEGAAAYLAFPVVLRNGGTANHDDYFLASVQSGGVEAEEVFDAGQDILGPPSGALLPDKEQRFTVVFGVADPADIVMEVAPGFDYDPVIYATTA